MREACRSSWSQGHFTLPIWTAQCGAGSAFLRWARPMIFARAADLKRLLGVQLSLQSREVIEEQLGNVGQSDSVAACDTFAGELLGEIAEEEIHGTGGGEVIDLGEKFGGEDLGLHHGDRGSETVGVVGAERRARGAIHGPMTRIDQHVTALAAGVLVLALTIGVLFWGT